MTSHKVSIKNLNENIVCTLCKGYFIDPVTLTECIHSCKYYSKGKMDFVPAKDLSLLILKPLCVTMTSFWGYSSHVDKTCLPREREKEGTKLIECSQMVS
jgi:hypothetical protein